MLLRFKHMLAAVDRARKMIERAGRDLCGDSLTEYSRIKRQFYIRDDLDIFIDDDMPEIEYGYILQSLMAVGLIHYEVIVPRKHNDVAVEHNDAPADNGSAETICNDDPDDDTIMSIEDYLPLEAFDDGHFEEEMEEILMMDDDPENDDE